MLRFDRKQQNSVKQLSLNKKINQTNKQQQQPKNLDILCKEARKKVCIQYNHSYMNVKVQMKPNCSIQRQHSCVDNIHA